MLSNFGPAGLLVILVVVAVLAFLLYLPIPMARSRGRSGLAWFVMGLLLSPVVAMIVLLVLGQKQPDHQTE